MRVYRITSPRSPERGFFCANLSGQGGAHSMIKSSIPKHLFIDTFIDELEITSDKASFVNVLNGGLPEGTKIERSWRITSRGGLLPMSAADV